MNSVREKKEKLDIFEQSACGNLLVVSVMKYIDCICCLNLQSCYRKILLAS